MRTVKLTIEYDGTLYHGWQVQLGVITIQGTLQECLSRLLGHPGVFMVQEGQTQECTPRGRPPTFAPAIVSLRQSSCGR